jgi:hypothetical protein
MKVFQHLLQRHPIGYYVIQKNMKIGKLHINESWKLKERRAENILNGWLIQLARVLACPESIRERGRPECFRIGVKLKSLIEAIYQ